MRTEKLPSSSSPCRRMDCTTISAFSRGARPASRISKQYALMRLPSPEHQFAEVGIGCKKQRLRLVRELKHSRVRQSRGHLRHVLHVVSGRTERAYDWDVNALIGYDPHAATGYTTSARMA